MPTPRERRFWRAVAWALGALLAALVGLRALGATGVPAEAVAVVASTLFCVGVGATVVAPRSSPARLAPDVERAVRRRQVGVALAISAALALLLMVPAVRQGPTPWVLAPIVALGPGLAVREGRLGSRSR